MFCRALTKSKTIYTPHSPPASGMRRLESAGATPAVGAKVVERSGDTARDAKVGRISAEVEKAAALSRKDTVK